jgi:hypothetical protein
LAQARQQYAQGTMQVSTDLVALYKALGGGWQDGGGAAAAATTQAAQAGAVASSGGHDVVFKGRGDRATARSATQR